MADGKRRLLSIDLLDGGEAAQLDDWGNRAVLTRPVTAVTIPELFAAQVAAAPEAVALVCGDRSWTYREVDEIAERLARVLTGHGASPGQTVALLFSRSAEAIVSMVAVHKAGAAYLPIDPALPDARVGVHARRCRTGGRGHDGGTAVALGWSRSGRRRLRRAGRRPRHEVVGAGTGGSGVHDLHLGYDRGAQGRGDHPTERDLVTGKAALGRAVGLGTGVVAMAFL